MKVRVGPLEVAAEERGFISPVVGGTCSPREWRSCSSGGVAPERSNAGRRGPVS